MELTLVADCNCRSFKRLSPLLWNACILVRDLHAIAVVSKNAVVSPEV